MSNLEPGPVAAAPDVTPTVNDANLENTERDDLEPIVGAEFVPPRQLRTQHTVLVPLGPEHNRSDYAAWTSSVDHIKATPGYGGSRSWPNAAMTIEQNRADLEAHRRHFEQRVGFTYTVLDRQVLDESGQAEVVGCLYIYEDRTGTHDADVRSWVRADRPELDNEVWVAVSAWLTEHWPFRSVAYAPR